jgi:phosphatidylinositol-4,5-bisphosphate 3-kinase catalytic subunit alpha/beta/delta
VGLIEVVLSAETIANIQKEKGVFSATSAFRKGSLLGKHDLNAIVFQDV